MDPFRRNKLDISFIYLSLIFLSSIIASEFIGFRKRNNNKKKKPKKSESQFLFSYLFIHCCCCYIKCLFLFIRNVILMHQLTPDVSAFSDDGLLPHNTEIKNWYIYSSPKHLIFMLVLCAVTLRTYEPAKESRKCVHISSTRQKLIVFKNPNRIFKRQKHCFFSISSFAVLWFVCLVSDAFRHKRPTLKKIVLQFNLQQIWKKCVQRKQR